MELVSEPVKVELKCQPRAINLQERRSSPEMPTRTLAEELLEAESDSEASALARRCFRSVMDPLGADVVALVGLVHRPNVSAFESEARWRLALGAA